MASRVTIPLDSPVTADGVRHEALHLRPMKRRDLKALHPGFDGEVGIAIAARLAGVSPTVILALAEADAERVGGIVSDLVDRVL